MQLLSKERLPLLLWRGGFETPGKMVRDRKSRSFSCSSPQNEDFSLKSEDSWFLDASRWRLAPKVHGHHLAGVSILLLEQKPELSLLCFVHTFSPLLHLLQFFPFSQSFSPSEDREDLNDHRASKKKMMPKKCSFAQLKYRHTEWQTAHQTHLPENWQERRVTHFTPNPLFLSSG